MKVLGVAGWSGSGKTTLVTSLVLEFVERGFAVSTVKHAHHDFDLDLFNVSSEVCWNSL